MKKIAKKVIGKKVVDSDGDVDGTTSVRGYAPKGKMRAPSNKSRSQVVASKKKSK